MAFSPMRLTVLLTAGLTLAGCEGDPVPQAKQATSNPSIDVELLFVVDGCKVYRFNDDGARYLTTCPGAVQWRQQVGKFSHDVEVPTQESR